MLCDVFLLKIALNALPLLHVIKYKENVSFCLSHLCSIFFILLMILYVFHLIPKQIYTYMYVNVCKKN